MRTKEMKRLIQSCLRPYFIREAEDCHSSSSAFPAKSLGLTILGEILMSVKTGITMMEMRGPNCYLYGHSDTTN